LLHGIMASWKQWHFSMITKAKLLYVHLSFVIMKSVVRQ